MVTGYIELVEAEHFGGTIDKSSWKYGHDGFVLVKFSDLSTVSMTVAQYDAIVDHAFDLARNDR